MIQLSNTVKQILQSDDIKFFYLVRILRSVNPLNFTTTPHSILMSDGLTYNSDGGLVEIEPPKISAIVDRAPYRISFTDASYQFKSYFETGAIGDTMIVRLGFYNTLGSVINGIEPGQPFTNISDTLLVYQGAIDSADYNIDVELGEAIATIIGSSPMADLDLVRPFYTNKNSMAQRNLGDTAFDKVFDGSGQITLKWGKK